MKSCSGFIIHIIIDPDVIPKVLSVEIGIIDSIEIWLDINDWYLISYLLENIDMRIE